MDPTSTPSGRPRPSVALVLGAGGVAGAAFHAGALTAIAEATGWDPRHADLVVGTSAGASTAAWLRVGVSAADLLARTLGQPPSAEGRRLTDHVPRLPSGWPTASDAPDGPAEAGPRRPLAPHLLVAALWPPAAPRPVVGLAGVLPPGRGSTEPLRAQVAAAHPQRWPDAPTWICALDVRDGRRAVFGRDPLPDTSLADAVAASVAIPGVLAPVSIGGRSYVDGGAHSPTNADLVAGAGWDVVLVVSPMSATRSALARTAGRLDVGRTFHSRTLGREVRAVRGLGSTVLVVQPTVADLAVRGRGPLDAARRPGVARQARDSVRARAEADPGWLAPLTG